MKQKIKIFDISFTILYKDSNFFVRSEKFKIQRKGWEYFIDNTRFETKHLHPLDYVGSDLSLIFDVIIEELTKNGKVFNKEDNRILQLDTDSWNMKTTKVACKGMVDYFKIENNV